METASQTAPSKYCRKMERMSGAEAGGGCGSKKVFFLRKGILYIIVLLEDGRTQ